jgi:hypothetical protein
MTLASSRSRAATRVAAFVGVAALAIVTLTGCIKVDGDLTINADATGTGTVGFELQKEAASFMGITDLDSFKTQINSGDLQSNGLSGFTSCTPSETDTGFLYSCSFTDEAFTDPSGIWTIAKTGNSITFHMVNAGQTGTQGSDATALLGDASLGSLNVKITFPGNITDITGTGAAKTSDTTATITGTMTTPLDVTITSESTGGGMKIAALLVVLAALAVVALIIVVIVVLLVRRRKAAPTDVEPAAASDGASVDGAAAATAATAVILDDAGAPTQVDGIPSDAAGPMIDATTAPAAEPAPAPAPAPAAEPAPAPAAEPAPDDDPSI